MASAPDTGLKLIVEVDLATRCVTTRVTPASQPEGLETQPSPSANPRSRIAQLRPSSTAPAIDKEEKIRRLMEINHFINPPEHGGVNRMYAHPLKDYSINLDQLLVSDYHLWSSVQRYNSLYHLEIIV
jgi:hypothetical protein